MYLEAYEKMLDAWMTFLADGVELLVEGALKHNAIDIFNAFLKCHLSPPDGSRNQVYVLKKVQLHGVMIQRPSHCFLLPCLTMYLEYAYATSKYTSLIIIC